MLLHLQGAFRGQLLALVVEQAMLLVEQAMLVLGMGTGSRDLLHHNLLALQVHLPRQASEAMVPAVVD